MLVFSVKRVCKADMEKRVPRIQGTTSFQYDSIFVEVERSINRALILIKYMGPFWAFCSENAVMFNL